MNVKIATLSAIALSALVGCDWTSQRDMRVERESSVYQTAMMDYKAGRIKAAAEGLRKACRQEPMNASARFQLACLLHESGCDYVEALCAYQSYILLSPSSDKARLAKERAALCEKEAAKELAQKYGLSNVSVLNRQVEALQQNLKNAERRNAKLNDDIAVAMQRVSHLLAENAKLKAAIKGDEGEGENAPKVDLRDARALLDEDETDRPDVQADVKKLRAEREDADIDRVKTSSDIAALRREADADEALAEQPPLPRLAPAAQVRRQTQATLPPTRPVEPLHELRPATYVVQEGDTLYRIAMRFYGRSSAWRLIREANKAVISVDGRVDRGMRIRLPDPK